MTWQNEDDFKHEDNLKFEDYLKNEDSIKNENSLNMKMAYIWRQPQIAHNLFKKTALGPSLNNLSCACCSYSVFRLKQEKYITK